MSSQILENRIVEIKEEAEQSIEELKHKALSTVSLNEAKSSINKKAKKKIHDMIVSFPIPNSKDDLLDLMDYLKIKKERNWTDDVYKEKYNQCVEKAIQLFPEDPIVKRIIAKKKKDAEDNEKSTKRTRVGCVIFVIIVISLAIVVKRLLF